MQAYMKILESSQVLLNVVKTRSTDLENSKSKEVKNVSSTADSGCIKSTSLH